MLRKAANNQNSNVVKDILRSIGTRDGDELIGYFDLLEIKLKDIKFESSNIILPKSVIQDIPSFRKKMNQLSKVGRSFKITEKDNSISISTIFDRPKDFFVPLNPTGSLGEHKLLDSASIASLLKLLEQPKAEPTARPTTIHLPAQEEKKSELSSTDFQKFLLQFPTVQSYCNEMMYGPAGYYSSGTVGFTESRDKRRFAR